MPVAATAGKIIRLTQMDRRKKEMEGKKERKKVEREKKATTEKWGLHKLGRTLPTKISRKVGN